MLQKKTNIVLIGMPGSGKSTLGKRLAKSLELNFLDTDKLIEQTEAKSVQAIIDSRGIAYFQSIEQAVLTELNVEHHLLATGGSAVLSESAMLHLSLSGVLVYLQISMPVMLERIQDEKTRGLVKMPTDSLEGMYLERLPYYQRWADLTLDNDLPLTNLRYSVLLETILSIK